MQIKRGNDREDVMQIKRGNDRLVVLLPALGLAIKFPRIYWNIRSNIKQMLKYKRWFNFEIFEANINSPTTIKRKLFRGIVENWREYWFYLQYKHSFCVPTYFSFLGLFNVQKLVATDKLVQIDLWFKLQGVVDRELLARTMHHWESVENFTYEKLKLQILDYGNIYVQAIILKFGRQIQDNFDPNYSWEKRKQEIKEEKI